MQVLVLDKDIIKEALPYTKLIPCMKQAMIEKSAKQTVMPPRNVVPLADGAAIGFMPSYAPNAETLGVKLVSVFPKNKKIDAHQGIVILFDTKDGRPLAFLNASEITARRTAAISAAATDVLARKDAHQLTVFGYGVQAKEHINAIKEIRNIQKVNIFSRKTVCEEINSDISFFDDVDEAIAGSDVVCLCTTAREPYITTSQLPAGIHVNAIGACRPKFVEISLENRNGLRIFLDDQKSASIEAEEINTAVQYERLDPKFIVGEIGEVFLGTLLGRFDENSITIFKSLGLAVQDIFAARLAVSEARRLNLGTLVEF